MKMICLNCQHIGHEDEFIENLGCCPHCNDETVVEADVSEMSIYEVALKEARALKDQNIIAVDLLKSRAKSRSKTLRLKSYL